MKVFSSLKKFFTPYRWQTIFRESGQGHIRNVIFGSTRETPVTIVLQVDAYKSTYRCYVTDGNTRQDYDVNSLISIRPHLESELNVYGIKI